MSELGVIAACVFPSSSSTGIIHQLQEAPRHFLPRIIFDTTVNLEVNKGPCRLNNILALAAAESFRESEGSSLLYPLIRL